MQDRIGQIGDYWLSKRPGSEFWQRTWFDKRTRQTRRSSLGTSDLSKAQIALAEWVVANSRMTKQSPQSVPLEQVLVGYWHRKGKNLGSKQVTEIGLAYWSEFFAGNTVAEVTAARQRDFVTWLEGRRDPPYAQGYIKRILTIGKAALNDAYREQELESVPYILPGEDTKKKKYVMTVADSAALWLASELPHERMMLALMYGTMARPEAALGLYKSFADLGRGLLDQNPPGRKQTRKYRPIVPVCGFLRPWLESAPDGPLVQWRGKSIESFKTAWRAMRSRAWLPKETTVKTIRHTMATELRAHGVPEAEIQGMLGHKAFSGRTEDYAQYRPDYLSQAVTVIDGYMERVSAEIQSASGTATQLQRRMVIPWCF